MQPKPNYGPLLRPFAKVFLTAMFTYQVLFWCYEKLRLDELREEKTSELKALEEQVEAYREKRRLEIEAGRLGGGGGNSDAGEVSKNKGWFGW